MKEKLKNCDSFIDSNTARYYSSRAAVLAEKYGAVRTGFSDLGEKYSHDGTRVLDIGCGSGRDLSEFKKAGFVVRGVDASDEMLFQAARKYPEISGSLVRADLPGLAGVTGEFDIILCSGVLQHIRTDLISASFKRIADLLDNDGIIILSFPLEYPDIDPDTERDSNGRLFIIRSEDEYRLLLEGQGFCLLERAVEQDSLKRHKISWAVHVYRKEAGI